MTLSFVRVRVWCMWSICETFARIIFRSLRLFAARIGRKEVIFFAVSMDNKQKTKKNGHFTICHASHVAVCALYAGCAAICGSAIHSVEPARRSAIPNAHEHLMYITYRSPWPKSGFQCAYESMETDEIVDTHSILCFCFFIIVFLQFIIRHRTRW